MTLNELLALATIIKNETGVDANSATRIGSTLQDIINFCNENISGADVSTDFSTLEKIQEILHDDKDVVDHIYQAISKKIDFSTGNLFVDPVFENGIASWNLNYNPENNETEPQVTIVDSGNLPDGVSKSVSIEINAQGQGIFQRVTKTVGKYYLLSFWAKASKTVQICFGNEPNAVTDQIDSSWKKFEISFVPTVSDSAIVFYPQDLCTFEMGNPRLSIGRKSAQKFKTINNQSILGEGNISITGGSGAPGSVDLSDYYTKEQIATIENDILTAAFNADMNNAPKQALLSISTAPSVNSSSKRYYNSTAKLLYQSIYSSGTYSWDPAGFAPVVGTIYTFGGNNYMLKDGALAVVGGASGGVSSYNDLTDKPNLALKADLVGGLIPASQLPSFVDDIIEILGLYTNAAIPDIPDDGYRYFNTTQSRIKLAVDGQWVNDTVNSGIAETGKIYVTIASTPYKSYRCSGSSLFRVDDVDLTNYYTKSEIQTAYALKSDIPANTLSSDIVVNLSGGRTFGKYATGSTIPATGKTIEQVLRDACLEAINPSASVSASGSIPFNSTTGSLTVGMTYTVNNPGATITGFVLSVRRGSGSYTQIYSGAAKSSHTHDIASLLGSDNVSNFNYKLVVTDSLGSTVTVTSNSITPATYAAPTCNISTGNPTRELGNVSTAFSGAISLTAQNGVSITSRKLQYSLNNSTWIDITTLGSNSVSYTHNDAALVNATVIYYRIQIDVYVIDGSNITNLPIGQVNFAYKQVFGYDASATPSLSTILAMGNNALTNAKAKTVTATAPSGNYTYYAYCAAAGDLASIIMDGVTPVLGSFTKMTDVSGTNSYGSTVTYRIYKSNAPAAFTSNNLVIS